MFSFYGDDDVWVFVNNKLALDLEGVHGGVSGTIYLANLGLTEDNAYNFDIFFAERHTIGSNLQITTSIELEPSTVPEPATMLLLGLCMIGLAGIRRKSQI